MTETAISETVMPSSEWRQRSAAHARRIDGWLGEHLAKRRDHGRHSIEEFLLTYYSFRPTQLRRWHPGYGITLEDADADDFGALYIRDDAGRLRVNVATIMERRRRSIEWMYALLKATQTRTPHYGCFGMHEWAMVYRQTADETRHNILALRLGADGTAAVVDEIKVRCSHFDAFRFFTAPARPLNLLQPARETQADNEQPGCLHANMDVYRWAYKLSPLTPSELVADCFALAREIRTLDMRASPYDLTDLGLDPVRVETPEGRADYIRHQREFSAQATELRSRLIELCGSILGLPPLAGQSV